jgi:hypothetical protein
MPGTMDGLKLAHAVHARCVRSSDSGRNRKAGRQPLLRKAA